tara:strand:+ start:48 stop:581 length:534 start_codon:yes stop_codon:yes gene_type:complete
MLLNIKKFAFIIFVVPLLLGHAPWGQHQVYRQMHMLIMCSKKDIGAYEFTKKLESVFKIILPEAKARVARAPHSHRIIDMLKTNQIPLAVLSHELFNELSNEQSEYKKFINSNTKIIYSFSEMVLISNDHFNEEKSLKVFKALNSASKKNNYNELKLIIKNNNQMLFDEGIRQEIGN